MSLYQGKKLGISVLGCSHGESVGAELSGIPAGLPVDEERLARFMARRMPSGAAGSTGRREPDRVVFQTGLRQGRTDGDIIRAVIYNRDARSRDYESLAYTPRPGHADYTAYVRSGGREDMRGGGVFSGRMTAPLCIAGGLALSWLSEKGITVGAHIAAVGGIEDEPFDPVRLTAGELDRIKEKPFPTLSEEKGRMMREAIAAAAGEKDSLGGIIECGAADVPAGLGGELFDGLESSLARLVFSVPAVKGFELGAGFGAARLRGSENNDEFYYDDRGRVKTRSNCHGGLLGGITSGMPLLFRAAFKPVPSIGRPQHTVDLRRKENTVIEIGGRHDACIVPRAVPVMESCMALALLDELL